MKVWRACLINYGLKGIPLYLKLRYHKTEKLTITGFKFPIKLRPYTKDRPTFEKVFLWNEYNLTWPTHLSIPKFIVDAGANIGLSALYFAKKFPEAQILALEPEHNNFKLLQQNTKAYPQIKTIRAGLWFKDAYIEIEDKGYGEAGFMVKEVKQATNKSIKALSVASLMKQFNLSNIDLLKIDIEGSEKEVFEHASDWINKVKVMTVETHDRMKAGTEKAVFDAFTGKPFKQSQLGENLIFIHE